MYNLIKGYVKIHVEYIKCTATSEKLKKSVKMNL